MRPLTTLTAVAVPLLRDNVDTDAIIPSREMRSTGKSGLADGLFAGWRYRSAQGRQPDPAFVLNQTRFAGAQILLSGRNFGCGSSREHAVWALAEFGFRAVLAASFAPIFYRNCIRNGVLPAALPADGLAQIAAAVEASPANQRVSVDVASGTASLPDGRRWHFELEQEAKAMLIEGLDEIDLTLKLRETIEAFRRRDRAEHPWIYLEDL
ncbi:MAG: 3-isopropylmalate dehydratase small subunit [Steroidobacteraceae bacterium]